VETEVVSVETVVSVGTVVVSVETVVSLGTVVASVETVESLGSVVASVETVVTVVGAVVVGASVRLSHPFLELVQTSSAPQLNGPTLLSPT